MSKSQESSSTSLSLDESPPFVFASIHALCLRITSTSARGSSAFLTNGCSRSSSAVGLCEAAKGERNIDQKTEKKKKKKKKNCVGGKGSSNLSGILFQAPADKVLHLQRVISRQRGWRLLGDGVQNPHRVQIRIWGEASNHFDHGDAK